MNKRYTTMHVKDLFACQQEPLLFYSPGLVRALGPSYWTMWVALALRVDSLTVQTMELESITAFMLKMLVFDVNQ